MLEKQKVVECKDKVTFYFTKFNDNIIIYNSAGTYEGNQMYWNSETILWNFKDNLRLKRPSHNPDGMYTTAFTLIMNDPNRMGKYYAVGGCGKKGERAEEPGRKYIRGIYLLESDDMYKWNVIKLIVHGDKYEGWNPVNRESIFDSNIDCFYS